MSYKQAFKKVSGERVNGVIHICCPQCGRDQELVESDEWYELNTEGKVHPIFVCMAKPYNCTFMGHIWIVNL